MNHAAYGRCLVMSDVSDDVVGTDEDEPIYQFKKGTKTMGEEDDEDMLLGKVD